MPLMQKIEKRLNNTSMFLSQGGKLEMVNSVFSSSTVFYAGTLKLHKGVINQVDKYRKHCNDRAHECASVFSWLWSSRCQVKHKVFF